MVLNICCLKKKKLVLEMFLNELRWIVFVFNIDVVQTSQSFCSIVGCSELATSVIDANSVTSTTPSKKQG